MYEKDDVIKANIDLHTAMAGKYKEEPHHRPENVARIREIIKAIRDRTGGERLLDVGCGMGFIIDIAKDYFKVIRGVDVTPAMIEKVDVRGAGCDIKVQIAGAENLPFEDGSFDVCVAHALLHHLHDVRPVMKEIHRVLRSGGVFYSDLDPNNYFWEAMKALQPNKPYSDVVAREVGAVLYKDEEIAQEFDIDKDVMRTAEHLKHVEGGFSEERLVEGLKSAGFSDCAVRYEWYLGEGRYIHTDKEAANAVRSYLREIMPLSRHLFKYISIIAEK